MKIITMLLFSVCLFITSNINGQSIKKYSESASSFNNSTQLLSNNYPVEDMYRIYKKGATGFGSVEKIKEHLEKEIAEFAKKKGRLFVILGQQVASGGWGRYPKCEIVFALTDKIKP